MCSAALNYSRGLSAVRIGIGFRDKVRIRLKVRLTLVLALGTHCTALHCTVQCRTAPITDHKIFCNKDRMKKVKAIRKVTGIFASFYVYCRYKSLRNFHLHLYEVYYVAK